jgi:hypothetical protein
LWKNRLSSFAFFGGFFKWGPNRRNQSSDFRSDFPNGGQIVEIKTRFFFAQEPEKKASLIQKLGLNSKNHKYHFGKKWLMEINVGLKIG